MKLGSYLLVACLTVVSGTATANSLNYNMKDERNCSVRYVQEGESIEFVVDVYDGEDGEPVSIYTHNIKAELYRDNQDVSRLLKPYNNTDTNKQGLFGLVYENGKYRLITTSSGEGSVCATRVFGRTTAPIPSSDR